MEEFKAGDHIHTTAGDATVVGKVMSRTQSRGNHYENEDEDVSQGLLGLQPLDDAKHKKKTTKKKRPRRGTVMGFVGDALQSRWNPLNQLDPLLKSSEAFPDGDVADDTGFSPFPGNVCIRFLFVKLAPDDAPDAAAEQLPSS